MRLSASVAAVLIIAARILQPPPERAPEPDLRAPVAVALAAAAEVIDKAEMIDQDRARL